MPIDANAHCVAVLSEVSPPTALSPFAAAAITGENPYKTTLHSWKYPAPAFLLPYPRPWADALGIAMVMILVALQKPVRLRAQPS